ncbi:conserved hypothetical protein [Ricinus communis]|uniref:RNase H type-1 domain-containing protein n=1 Tax=Ricinus communis TaxID=3988 RepID=B9RNH6_RICCO|nr:conserved hypothetical protein [Ricinus communis]
MDSSFPYQATQLLQSSVGARNWELRSRTPALVTWQPPPITSIKWNVDASSKEKLGPSGIGGVFRNSLGQFIGIFSCSTGIKGVQ